MSNPTELPDLDKLEALAKAAQISILRMGMNGRPNDYFALMNAMSPEAVLALIALARRAQPEGEAPQAEPVGEVVLFGRECKEISWAKGKLPPVGAKLYTHPPAATLSPLCGAQHAESGKGESTMQGVIALLLEIENCPDDGEPWVIAGKARLMLEALAAQQAAAPGAMAAWFDAEQKRLDAVTAYNAVALVAEREIWPGRDVNPEFQAMSAAQNAEFHARGALFASRTSAPGTSEAPKPAWPKRLSEEEVRELALQHLHDDTESAGRNSFFTFSAEGLDGFAIDLMDRAAQLDGGQEGSESNG